MKRHWELDELIEQFTFLPNELSQLGNKSGATRLGFAALFKFFQHEAKFPTHKGEVPKEVLLYIAKQLNLDILLIDEYDWKGRTIKYHRAQIRDFFGYKEPPTSDRIDRITRSAIYTYENQFFQETYQKLSKETVSKMENLINDLAIYDESEVDYTSDSDSMSFSELRADPGRIGLESVFREIAKLRTIKQLELPNNLFSNIPQKIIKRYKLRVVSEKLPELRRHPEHVRYSILSP